MAERMTPLYQQIFGEIKAEIDRGDYAPKEKIPSEPELSQKYGVSRITVRRAIEELCAQFEGVTKEQVARSAQRLELDTVYFLKGKEA